MNIDATETVAVIEQDRLLMAQVHQQAAEPAIQFFQSAQTHFFVKTT